MTRYATFASADGAVLRFSYTVQAGDADTDGLDVVADSLELNGGTIMGAGSEAAELSHPASRQRLPLGPWTGSSRR